MNSFINLWGPALLVCFTLLTGLFYQNSRLSDLREALTRRMDDMNASLTRRMDDISHEMRAGFADVKTRLGKLEDRITDMEKTTRLVKD